MSLIIVQEGYARIIKTLSLLKLSIITTTLCLSHCCPVENNHLNNQMHGHHVTEVCDITDGRQHCLYVTDITDGRQHCLHMLL